MKISSTCGLPTRGHGPVALPIRSKHQLTVRASIMARHTDRRKQLTLRLWCHHIQKEIAGVLGERARRLGNCCRSPPLSSLCGAIAAEGGETSTSDRTLRPEPLSLMADFGGDTASAARTAAS